jgi:membrane-associated protease RseP (regulator of RpoE activity)
MRKNFLNANRLTPIVLFAGIVLLLMLNACDGSSTTPMPNRTDIGLQAAPVLGILINQYMQIVYVEPGSGAAEAGIQPGDILSAVNSQKVTKPEQAQKEFLKNAAQPIQLTISRKGKEMQFGVTPLSPSTSDRTKTATPVPVGTIYF